MLDGSLNAAVFLTLIATFISGIGAAWVGNRYAKRLRNEDLGRQVSRLEGQLKSRPSAIGNPFTGNLADDINYMLGTLVTGLAEVRSDVSEIRLTQRDNRLAADQAHAELRSQLEKKIDDLSTEVKQLQRNVARVLRRRFAGDK